MSPGLSSILNPQSSILKALVLRPIQREKTRTALTIAGIAVGVAVVVAIQLANQSALRAFRESVDAIAGRANYQLVPDVAPLDESVLFQLQPLWREGVRGLLEAEGPATAFNGSIAVCDISVAQRSFGMIGKLSRVDLLVPEDSEESGRPARPREAGRMPALLGNAWRGFSLPPGTRIERPSRRNERVEKMLRA